jgi:hypothetical protein
VAFLQDTGERIMASSTIFLAKLLGLFMIAVSLAAILRGQAMLALLVPLVGDAPLLLILGLLLTLAGLAMVLAHNVWAGGILPIVVSLIGWITLARGVAILIAPGAVTQFVATVAGTGFPYVAAILPLILGTYLTYAGFTSRAAGT